MFGKIAGSTFDKKKNNPLYHIQCSYQTISTVLFILMKTVKLLLFLTI